MLVDLCGRKAEPKYDRDDAFAVCFCFCFGKKEKKRESEKERKYWLPGGRMWKKAACSPYPTDRRTAGEQLLAFPDSFPVNEFTERNAAGRVVPSLPFMYPNVLSK
jgi:hypothetical protein